MSCWIAAQQGSTGRTMLRPRWTGPLSRKSGVKRSRTRTLCSLALFTATQHPLLATKQRGGCVSPMASRKQRSPRRPFKQVWAPSSLSHLSVSLPRTHPMYSSSKGTSEDRPLDATTARTGPALAAAATAPEAPRIIVLVLRSLRSLRPLCVSLAPRSLQTGAPVFSEEICVRG